MRAPARTSSRTRKRKVIKNPVEIIPRGKRADGIKFGRAELGVPGGDLTDFGCPDCRGVLAVREEGSHGHLGFCCRVGHVYSGESLVKAKEEQLEMSLWSGVEVYEELILLHDELAARARQNELPHIASAYERRSKRAKSHMADLRALVSRDAPAAPDRKKS